MLICVVLASVGVRIMWLRDAPEDNLLVSMIGTVCACIASLGIHLAIALLHARGFTGSLLSATFYAVAATGLVVLGIVSLRGMISGLRGMSEAADT